MPASLVIAAEMRVASEDASPMKAIVVESSVAVRALAATCAWLQSRGPSPGPRATVSSS